MAGTNITDFIKNNMKQLLFSVFFLAFCNCLFAQQKQGRAFSPFPFGPRKSILIGNSQVRIRYAFQAQDLNNEDTWIDCGQLLFNDTLTKYSSYFLEQHCEAVIKWQKENPNKNYFPSSIGLRGRRKHVWSEYQYSNILIIGNKLTELAIMPSAEPQQWRYTEDYPSISWVLSTDTTTICGYLCQKATCHWRGRNYIAWFAPQLPLKFGPWKFGGLPGLIMKIYDTKHLYTWQAVAIDKGEFPIWQIKDSYFKTTTRNKVLKMQRDYNVKYAELAGVRHGPQGIPVTTRYHYDQLELE